MTAATERAVYAAGCVVWRVVDGRVMVLLVHRTKYRDATLPKGKVDPGESLAETAVREVHEETGIRGALGAPLGLSRYTLPNGKQKVVHYWSMQATPDAVRECEFRPNGEIAGIEWLTIGQARKRLSYPVDVEILDGFAALVDDGVLETFPVIALRHGKATPRSGWDGADAGRPLLPRGKRQARALTGMLHAFGVRKIVSSTAVRCVKTVTPFAKAEGRKITQTDAISQDAWENGEDDVRGVVGRRVRSGKPAVLCSHGPVLPSIIDELVLATGTLRGSYVSDAAALETGAFSVVHIPAHKPGSGIVAIETHAPKA